MQQMNQVTTDISMIWIVASLCLIRWIIKSSILLNSFHDFLLILHVFATLLEVISLLKCYNNAWVVKMHPLYDEMQFKFRKQTSTPDLCALMSCIKPCNLVLMSGKVKKWASWRRFFSIKKHIILCLFYATFWKVTAI